MSTDKNTLEDRQYSNLSATLIIKDGKATVILHDTFELDLGTEIPLARKNGTLIIEKSSGNCSGIDNGHGII